MKLTKGEFCQFSLHTRLQLLKEFGRHVTKKEVERRMISVYSIFGFYVEVLEHTPSRRLEKVEPVKNDDILQVYTSL